MTDAARKFDFGTVFSKDGEVLRDGDRVKRILTADEVEIVRKEAFEAGVASETAQAANQQAAAVQAVASQMQMILSRLQGESESLRADASRMALIAARKIAGAAIDKNAAEGVVRFIEEIMTDLRGEPHFAVECAGPIAGIVAQVLEQTAAEIGFEGAIKVRANPDMAGADCRLAWGSGTIERSQTDLETRIEALVAEWQAAAPEDRPEAPGNEDPDAGPAEG
ncbi:hypothetical protein V0U79_07005 [Hyphobacterium sp. HN65]|uniref:Flagellar assembly protein FliH/Type III secretion system HrpE domain-containing protein n=1 Tax=Hyphobacterium lacteum TaxID=3116575 RepID=A0ABU7LQD1_9PROT|nr:hypothetical protein [Hyphobacterium sp. HN65]MEE2526110.1 hypothetical protein [Hyphobacterium sp. HN65]